MALRPDLMTVAQWKALILKHGMGESLADEVLMDLDGYDYPSIDHRRDVRRLVYLFAAMQELAVEAYNKSS